MTNHQLLLSIGVSSALVMFSWISKNQMLTRLELDLDRLDSTNSRIDEGRADNHRDALEILKAMTALHERVAIV